MHLDLLNCTDYPALPSDTPPALATAAADWTATRQRLAAEIAEAFAGCDRRANALHRQQLPTADDRRAPARLLAGMEQMLQHLAKAAPITSDLSSVLIASSRASEAKRAKLSASLNAALVKLGYDGAQAPYIAGMNPDIQRLAAERDSAATKAGNLPSMKGGTLLHLATALETEIAQRETR